MSRLAPEVPKGSHVHGTLTKSVLKGKASSHDRALLVKRCFQDEERHDQTYIPLG